MRAAEVRELSSRATDLALVRGMRENAATEATGPFEVTAAPGTTRYCGLYSIDETSARSTSPLCSQEDTLEGTAYLSEKRSGRLPRPCQSGRALR